MYAKQSLLISRSCTFNSNPQMIIYCWHIIKNTYTLPLHMYEVKN